MSHLETTFRHAHSTLEDGVDGDDDDDDDDEMFGRDDIDLFDEKVRREMVLVVFICRYNVLRLRFTKNTSTVKTLPPVSDSAL